MIYKKNFLSFIGVVVFGAVLFFALYNPENQTTGAKSYKDATYSIEGRTITLKKGVSEVEEVEGSASKIITRYFGNEVTHDFDGDGRDDVVFLLTQETGGSGTFFYVVPALNTEEGYVGGEAFFLGDRIAPQTTEMSREPKTPNVVIVNYAVRNSGEPMSVSPSHGKSVWLLLNTDTLKFGEVSPLPDTNTTTKNTNGKTPSVPTNSPTETILPDFSLGQAIKFSGLTLTTTSVVEDSRCPKGSKPFACIWEGTVRVIARLRPDTYTTANPDDIQEFRLGVPQNYDDFVITLSSVLPYPSGVGSIRSQDYRFKWLVVPR